MRQTLLQIDTYNTYYFHSIIDCKNTKESCSASFVLMNHLFREKAVVLINQFPGVLKYIIMKFFNLYIAAIVLKYS